MKIITEPLYLRPSIDLLFENEEDLDIYFCSTILDFLFNGDYIYSDECDVFKAAEDFFKDNNSKWYVYIDNILFKINLKQVNKDSLSGEFLFDLINRNEEEIIYLFNTKNNNN